MFKKLLIVAIIMLTTRFTVANDKIITNHPPTTTVTGEQVLQLPQDENKLYLTLYGDPSDERYQQIRKWFNENKGLLAIRTQVHYAAIDTDSKLFQERYADEVQSTPCLRFVTPGGIELMCLNAEEIPMSDHALNNGVRTELMQKLFGGRKQREKQESPQDRIKRRIDDKIDEKIDNANLPPATKYVVSRLVKGVIGIAFVSVVIVGVAIAAVGVVRELQLRR